MSSMTFPKPDHTDNAQQWRADLATARIVDQSISVQACHGTFYAALLLRTKNVDIDIALRVLLHPHKQRNAYPQAMFQPRHYEMQPPLIYTHTHT